MNMNSGTPSVRDIDRFVQKELVNGKGYRCEHILRFLERSPSDGYRIGKNFQKEIGTRPQWSSLYGYLRRLYEFGLIDKGREEGPRKARPYSLTPLGKVALNLFEYHNSKLNSGPNAELIDKSLEGIARFERNIWIMGTMDGDVVEAFGGFFKNSTPEEDDKIVKIIKKYY